MGFVLCFTRLFLEIDEHQIRHLIGGPASFRGHMMFSDLFGPSRWRLHRECSKNTRRYATTERKQGGINRKTRPPPQKNKNHRANVLGRLRLDESSGRDLTKNSLKNS